MVMIVAGMVTLLFHRLKQPVVLGYILAGFIIGPHTPPFPLIHDEATIETLAELGIIFLMFSLGLEFNLRKLTQVGAPAFLAALLEIVLLFWVGFEIGGFFGWKTMDRIFLGAMLSMSSTTVIIKVLSEMGKMKERFSQLIFGILIIEDILGIAMIALLSSIAMTGNLGVGDVGVTLGKLGVFLTVVLVVGLLTVPRLIGYVARFKSNEMLVLAVVGLCFGVSLLAVKLGYSVALGAFVIGAVIAEAREIHRVETLIEPIRDMFSAVFFVAIGMLIDPRMLVEHAIPIAVITLAVIIGKIVACSLGTFAAGVDGRTSLRVGMGLAQIGEFSFIIASLGQTLDVTSKFLYPIAVAVSAITTLLTPYLIKGADGVVDWFGRKAPQPVLGSLGLYSRWVTDFRNASPRHPGYKHVRSITWQVALNIILIAGVFALAAYGANTLAPKYMAILQELPGGARTACWTLAVVVCLPLYIASIRKIQALGMLLSEIAIPAASMGQRTPMLRTWLANVIYAVGVAFLGIVTILISSAILPSTQALIVLVTFVVLLGFLFGTHFNRLYSRAKFALVETWSNPPPVQQATVPLPALLRDAVMETFTIAGSTASGRQIRELELRTKTGASIVALERDGRTIVNPAPDEELKEGDRALLLGDKAQLAAAGKLFQTRPETS